MLYNRKLVSIGSKLLILKRFLANGKSPDPIEYFKRCNVDYLKLTHDYRLAQWKYQTDITKENLQAMIVADIECAKFCKRTCDEVKQFDIGQLKEIELKRQFLKFTTLGLTVLPDELYKLLMVMIAEMTSICATATVCDLKNNCQLSLYKDLYGIMATSDDPKVLQHIWTEWRQVTGTKILPLYPKYVEICNESAKLNNLPDYSQVLFITEYETKTISQHAEQLWLEIEPLYKQLHAYVRFKLRKIYGDTIVSEKGPIPAHLLGDMWAKRWVNIAERTKPFPDIELTNITAELKSQQYTAVKMFKMADEFFVSLNLSPVPDTFWKNSIFEKLTDEQITYPPCAWDMADGEDYRIKMCPQIDHTNFLKVHREMALIQYQMQCRKQPGVLRTGACAGFGEAIGGMIGLSVCTRKHLQAIGLIKSELAETNLEIDLNHLYCTALNALAFLPFSYIMDLYRWDIYCNRITPKEYNCHWWKLCVQYQGIEPPADRPADCFDAASKLHFAANISYIRYFIANIIQFQFHQAICEHVGLYDPRDSSKQLYQCSIYKNVEAGNLLKKVLELGASRSWPAAMEMLTGTRNLTCQPMIEYFRPIVEYIAKINVDNKVFVGWESSTKKIDC